MVTTLLVSVRTRDNPQPSPSFLEVVDEKVIHNYHSWKTGAVQRPDVGGSLNICLPMSLIL